MKQHNERPEPQPGDQCEYEAYDWLGDGLGYEWRPLGILLSVGKQRQYAYFQRSDGTRGRIAYKRIRRASEVQP